jgi:hypothetical protein
MALDFFGLKLTSHLDTWAYFFPKVGNWHVHVNHIIDKVTLRLNVFRTLKFKLQRNLLQVIYFSFIRPLLEYGDIISSADGFQ